VTLAQTQYRVPDRMVAGIALAAAIFGVLLGSSLQATYQGPASAPTLAPREHAVLEAAREWEVRYRQMHPGSN
jgi:hypothetical protein